jgi:hypothetical protein
MRQIAQAGCPILLSHLIDSAAPEVPVGGTDIAPTSKHDWVVLDWT